VALSDAALARDPAGNGPLGLSMQTTSTALSGGWRTRDTLVVAAGAVTGLIAAAIIVLL
jgi:hypothetical protein